MSQRVTLEDIARESGVSLATVSLALRDKPGINDETRQRVIETARNLGYRKRNLSEANTSGLQQVGVIIRLFGSQSPHSNQFYSPVLAGIDLECRRQQINLMFATMPVDEHNVLEDIPRMLLEDDLDGLLLVGAYVDSRIERLIQRREAPTVLVDSYAEHGSYDAILSDNLRGAYEAVSHLISQGHRHIGVVASHPNAYPSILERRFGYIQALQAHGIQEQYFADSRLLREDAGIAACELLRANPQITALFCCNDETAVGVIQALPSIGRSVPHDVSVIGFDDIDLAAHVVPALSSMQVDKVSMGRLAVQLLAYRVANPHASQITNVLRPTRIDRQSVLALQTT
jgi:LacI family transcriptional regulator